MLRDNAKRCRARTRAGERCKNPAVTGYDVCRMHGANPTNRGGAPPTTGEYEAIWMDQLDEGERVLFRSVQTGVLAQLDDEIRLITIRERRMLGRIASLMGVDFTEVERKSERGMGPMGPVDKTDRREEATLGQIQRIEEALTRVQDKKAKLLELKHKIESGEGLTKPEMRQYIEALTKTAHEVWGDGT